jgi:hypothetical protein
MVGRPRPLELASEIVVDPGEVLVEIALIEFGRVALELTLLAAKLIPRAVLQDQTGRRLTVDVLASNAKRGVFSGLESQSIQLSLPQVTVEYLQTVLLRAYRDGMADVDHIHVETTSIDLTFLFTVSAPPMSGQEAARILGI